MLQSALGLAVLIGIAWLSSSGRRRVPWRMLLGGVGLQFAIAGLMLKVPLFSGVFMGLNKVVLAMEEATRAGTAFVFGYLGGGPVPFPEPRPGSSFILAFQALPLVIVIGALTSLLFYWRILPTWCGCSPGCSPRPWESAARSAWGRAARSSWA